MTDLQTKGAETQYLSKELEDFKKMHFEHVKKFADDIATGKAAHVQKELTEHQNALLNKQVGEMHNVLKDRESAAAMKPFSAE